MSLLILTMGVSKKKRRAVASLLFVVVPIGTNKAVVVDHSESVAIRCPPEASCEPMPQLPSPLRESQRDGWELGRELDNQPFLAASPVRDYQSDCDNRVA